MKRQAHSLPTGTRGKTQVVAREPYHADPSDAIVQALAAPFESSEEHACYACNREFTHTPFVIPTLGPPMFVPDAPILGEGCFCCPECALGYLLRTTPASPERQEQAQILQFLYSPNREQGIYIRDAPDPHVMLKRYHGKLTLTEYHEMIEQSNLYLRVMPLPVVLRAPSAEPEDDDGAMAHLGGQFHNQKYRLYVRRNSTAMYGQKLDEINVKH